LNRAVIFGLSVGDSHIHSSRTLPRYSYVSLALQLPKYPLAVSQLAFYPCPTEYMSLDLHNSRQEPEAISARVKCEARVQIRCPRSLFTIKRRNNTYDVTHFSYFDSTFLAGMLKIQIVATDIDIN